MKWKKYLPVFFILISLIGFVLIAYVLKRNDFIPLLVIYLLCFAVYYIFVKSEKFSWKQVVLWGCAFRFVFLFSTPELSDDYHRFIWDAKLVVSGENPWKNKPSDEIYKDRYIDIYEIKLHDKLNSKEYYSVYPPFQQLFFIPSGITDSSQQAIFLLHLVILLGEILLLFFLFKAIQDNLINISAFAWIWLNPLWIIEVNGNLHFEGWMCTFLMAGIYYFHKKKRVGSVFFGLAAGLKMLPLMIMPFFKNIFGFKKSIPVIFISGMVFLLSCSYIIISGMFYNFFQSIDLYYHKFEFNGSFYPLLGWLGSYFVDAHPITYVSNILLAIFIAFYGWLYFKKRAPGIQSFFKTSALIWLFYYLCATTVHPWYVLPVMFFSVLGNFQFGIVWSALVFFSYAWYSGNEDMKNIFWMLEYIFLFSFIFYELTVKTNVLRGIAKD